MSGDLRVRMLFEANAQAARAEAQSLKDAMQQLAAGTKAAGGAAAGATPPLNAMGGAAKATAGDILRTVSTTGELNTINQILRASINPLVGQYEALQRSMRDVATAEQLGALTGREAALAHDVLAREVNALMAEMAAVGTSIDGTSLSMTRSATAAQELINQMTGVSRATDETIADQLRHGAALDALRARYNPLFAASRQYEIELNAIAEAERLGAISAMEAAAARTRASAALAPVPNQIRQVGASSQTAAAYAGQLSYQLNDIGMMMAMGQSPFMLMVQQGPQVTQVFDQMRRSGMAIGPAIAGAFTSMLNPVSLATMAVIGIGAAAVQWFTAGAEKARTLSESVEDLSGRVRSYESAVEMALTPMGNLRKEWGDQAVQVREIYDALADLERLRAMAALDESTKTITRTFAGLKAELNTIKDIQANLDSGRLTSEQSLMNREALETWADDIRQKFGMTIEQAERVQVALDQVSKAKGPVEFAAAVSGLRTEIMAVAQESGRLPTPLLEAADAVITAELEARKLAGPLDESKRSAEALAGVDIASGISGAAAEALVLAQRLGVALTTALSIKNMQAAADYSGAGRGSDPRKFMTPDTGPKPLQSDAQALIDANDKRIARAARTGRGRGGGAAEERDALKELIEAQERQIEVLHTTDPVQREILKNHEALKDATAGEKAEVEALIAERQRLEEIRDRVDEIGKTGEDAFKGLITGAHSFSDALSMVLMKLADMAASDAWDILWGDGGGKGGFGLGDLLGGLFGLDKKADGGRIAGPGGPRDDRILTWTSNGEYVVNARATAAHLPLIEAINAGASPGQLIGIIGGQRLAGFADGGRIGDAAPAGWRSVLTGAAPVAGSRSGPRDEARLRVYFDRELNLRGEIEQISGRVAADVVVDGLNTFSAEVLPDRVQQIDANPRMRG